MNDANHVTVPASSVAAGARRVDSRPPPVAPLLNSSRPPSRWSSLSRVQKALVIVGHLAFWPFNLLFCSLALLGYMPLLLLDLVVDAFMGATPWTFAIGAVLLAFVPLLSTAGGLFLVVRRDGRDLLWVLLGVEVPALLLLMSRTFGMQQLTGSASLLVVGGVVGLAAVFVRVLFPPATDTNRARLLLLQPFVSVLVAVGIFVLAVLGSLALPAWLSAIGDMPHRLRSIDDLVIALLVTCVFTTFSVTPFVGPLVWMSSTIDGARALWRQRGRALAVAATLGPIAAFCASLAVTWASPGAGTIERLEHPPTTDAERQALLDDRSALRAGLIDAALHEQRYPLDSDDRPWGEAWRQLLGEDGAALVDNEIRRWAAPFTFPGHAHDAKVEARRQYRAFFGDELERVERDAVLDAMAATYTRELRFAGLINVGEQRVRLVAQQVTATPTDHGTVIVEVHDEWSNLTPTDLEIQLSFSLPPTAAVTGLWLHDVDDKKRAFPFALAPRGAAQQVYREQVQRRVDPALLEQVGPQQYRLRVFPVPARPVDEETGTFGMRRVEPWSSTTGKHAHVWLTYEAVVVDGVVPVPTLLEARNAFFDDVAERAVQGKPVGDSATWVPVAPRIDAPVAALTSSPWRLADGSCVAVAASPTGAPTDFGALRGRAVDVVIDRSLAMESLQAPYSAALQALRHSGARIETVSTSSSMRNEPATRQSGLPADTTRPLWFGMTSLKEMLAQRVALKRLDGAAADVVIVLAATGSFESSDDTPLPVDGARPVIGVLHLGALPTGYDDATADAVSQSGGIITTSLTELAAHLAGGPVLLSAGLGITPTTCSATTRAATSLVARLAVRLFDRGRDRSDASTLDRLHAIALSVPVVTPYSSMIVLVNDEQRARLDALNAQADRYQREVEDGAQVAAPSAKAMLATNETAQQSLPFQVVGTPEPEEWLLLFIAMGAIGAVALRRRRVG